jgi:hypothetical protein
MFHACACEEDMRAEKCAENAVGCEGSIICLFVVSHMCVLVFSSLLAGVTEMVSWVSEGNKQKNCE